MKHKSSFVVTLFSVALTVAVQAQQAPQPPTTPPAVPTAPAAPTNKVQAVVAPPPQIQVPLGSLEAVRAMEGNLQIARQTVRDAEKAWKASPQDAVLQSQLAAAKVALGTAEENLKQAKKFYSAREAAQHKAEAEARRAARDQQRYYYGR